VIFDFDDISARRVAPSNHIGTRLVVRDEDFCVARNTTTVRFAPPKPDPGRDQSSSFVDSKTRIAHARVAANMSTPGNARFVRNDSAKMPGKLGRSFSSGPKLLADVSTNSHQWPRRLALAAAGLACFAVSAAAALPGAGKTGAYGPV
jgi:hypothetical protein